MTFFPRHSSAMDRNQPPLGAVTQTLLEKELGIARTSIQLMAQRLLAQGMEVAGTFWSRSGEATYILRDGVEAIRLQAQKTAPEGWVSGTSYGGGALTDIARFLYPDHPEYCEFYRDSKSGKLTLHYAPEFLERMRATVVAIGQLIPAQDVRAGELRERLGAAAILLGDVQNDAMISAEQALDIIADIRARLREGMVPMAERRRNGRQSAAQARLEKRSMKEQNTTQDDAGATHSSLAT